MTLYPQWNGLQITSSGTSTAAGVKVSIDGYSAFVNPNSPPSAQTLVAAYCAATSPCVFEMKAGNAGQNPNYKFGFAMGTPATNNASDTNTVVVNANGVVQVNGSVLFTLTFTSTVMFYVIPGIKCWMTPDATGVWYDGVSTYSLSQVEAGMGGINISSYPASINPEANFYSGGSGWGGVIQLNSGQAAFIATPPTGATTLPAGLWGTVPPTAPSATIYVPWTCPRGLTGTLQYSTDGSTWTNCGGGNTGTAGSATAGTAGSQQGLTQYYYFRDSGNTALQIPGQTLFVITAPSGAGPLIAWGAGFQEGAPLLDDPIPFPNGPYTKLYMAAALSGGNYSLATGITILDAASTPTFEIQFDDTNSSRNNLKPLYGPSGATGDQVAYAAYGTTALCTEVLDASTISMGAAYGTAVLTDIVQSGTGTLGPNVWPPGTLTTPRFVSAQFYDPNTFGATVQGQTLGYAIWAPPASSESLTLTSVSGTYGGYLTAIGVSNMGPPGGLNVSTTGTAGTFSAGTSFTTASGTVNAAFSVTGTTILSAGTLSIAVQDSTYSYVVSNELPLVVAAPPLLTIDTASYSATSEILSIQGTNTGTLTALAMQIDAGGFRLASSLSTSGTMYSGGIGGYISPGAHTVQSQNATTGQLSNVATFVVGVPPTPSINSGLPGSANAYTSLQIIPLQPVPSQQVACSLNGQAVTLNIYTRGAYGFLNLYMDVYSNGALVVPGVICQNGNEIIRNSYFGFNGDFAFWDQAGSSDPEYTGLGSRWVLAYYS